MGRFGGARLSGCPDVKGNIVREGSSTTVGRPCGADCGDVFSDFLWPNLARCRCAADSFEVLDVHGLALTKHIAGMSLGA